MKSPFAVFRKHQKVLMVVLTGLAMFAFVVLDSLTQNMAAFPPIFGGLIGIGLAWWLASKAPYTWAWVILGAVGGGFLGAQFQMEASTQAAVKTSFGEISRDELNQAIQRREIVNNFLYRAFQAAHAGEENPPTFTLQNAMFGGSGDPRQEALMHLLMMREAKELNFQVGNQQVAARIDQATSGKLSAADYQKVLRETGLSDAELFRLIREQITSEAVRRQLAPRYIATPEDYWDAYQKVNVKQEMAVVPILVESFEDEVGEPAEGELRDLFEEYKDQYPQDGEPGFRQPGRIKLGYVEVDYDTVAKTVPEVTDEEVEQYYEENKEDYRNEVPEDFPGQQSQNGPELTPGNGADTGEPSSEKADGPAMTDPNQPPAEDDAKAPEKSEADAKPETSEPKKESETSSKNSSAKETEKVEKESKESSGTEEQPADDKKETNETPAENEEQTDDAQSSLNREPFGQAFARIQDEPTEQPEGDEKNTEKKPEAEADTDKSPSPEKSQEAPKEKEEAKKEPADASKKSDGDEQPKEEESAEKKEMKEAPATSDKATSKEEQEEKPAEKPDVPKYQPLDDDLKAQIREQIKTQRVLDEMDSIISNARGELVGILSQYVEADEDSKDEVARKIRQQVREYAEKHGLRYVETPYYSAGELEASEDHPIGSSTAPSANRFERSEARTVVEQHFDVPDRASLERKRYQVMEAEDPRTLNRFLHWQANYKPAHMPDWDDEGIQEDVRETWVRLQARELAKKRAEEVAEMLRGIGEDKTWKEALEGKTETGKEGDPTLNVTYTGEFSWLSRSSAPNPNPFAPPPLELTDIPIIYGGVTEEFMETVFRDLDEGDIGTVWGGDRRYINVVRIGNRTDLEQVREQFLASQDSLFSGFSPYQMQTIEESRMLIRQWNSRIYDQYEVEWVNEDEAAGGQ